MSSAGARLRSLLARESTVLAVHGLPNALHAKLMEASGVEAGFVGGVTSANYTGFPNTSVNTMTEYVMIGGYVARSVQMPVILDVDTGPASFTAIQRLVDDCVHAGIACLRFEDQLPGMKRQDPMPYEVLPRELAAARYRCAADARDAIDPTFVIGAKTYARGASNGGLEETIDRLNLFRDSGADWVHFESPESTDEIVAARAAVTGILAVRGPHLSIEECARLGLQIAWFNAVPEVALEVTTWEFIRDFRRRGPVALTEFREQHADSIREIEELQLLGSHSLQALQEKYLGEG